MYLGWEQVLTLSQPTPTPGPTAALLQLPAEAELGQRAEVSPLTRGRQRHSLKVVTSWFQEGSGLVGHRPHHNRRVILVPADHLLHHLQVVLQRHVAVALAAGPGEEREQVTGRQAGRAGLCGWRALTPARCPLRDSRR